MKKGLKTVAAVILSGLSLSAPGKIAIHEANQKIQNANKNAVLKLREEKKTVTIINDRGGIDFEPTRILFLSPIFEPKKHTVQSYRAQQRAAKKRRK